MSDIIPTLYYEPRCVYLLHGTNPYQGDALGQPVGFFYDYASAKTALDVFEDPHVSLYQEDQIMVFLVMYELNSYGLLQNPRICEYKTGKQVPERVSLWEQMQRSR
jgi:hypothetical protein